VEVSTVNVGSVFGGLEVRKFWVAGRTLFASNCVKEVKNSTGFERGDRLLQVACLVSVLAKEHLGACSPPICTAKSASSDHHVLGGRPRTPKGMEALAAFKRSDKKDRSVQWIFCASSIGGRGCSEMNFSNSSQ